MYVYDGENMVAHLRGTNLKMPITFSKLIKFNEKIIAVGIQKIKSLQDNSERHKKFKEIRL